MARALAQAPATLVMGDSLPDIEGLDLTYKPQMGELSALALPSNLPLDFLADIHFDGAALPSIAPSSHRGAGAADYSLPQLTDGSTGTAAQASQAYQPPPSAKEPPPPPPPPGPPVGQTAAGNENDRHMLTLYVQWV